MTVIVQEIKKTIVVKEKAIRVIAVAKQGPPGPTGPQGLPGEGSGLAIRINFSYGDASPAFLYNLITGKTLLRVSITITSIFDGTNPNLTIGITGTPDLFFNSSQIDLKTQGTYETNPSFTNSVDTGINLYITPDGDTNNGAGFILLYTA